MRPAALLAAAITIAQLAAARPVASQIAGPGPTPAAARLDAEVPPLLEAAGVPGFSGALIVGGEVVWTGAFGVTDTESRTPVTAATIFQAASLTKQVFAVTALRLAERGVIDLDRPLAEYLPNERMAHDVRYERITGRMALSHSTGLPNWGGDRLELEFDPGTAFRYSGEGYVYLQRALEELTGRGLGDLVREEVFDRLGLEDSWMTWHPSFEGRAAARHDDWGSSTGVFRGEEVNAAWSLLTTAGDYARFLADLMGGEALEPATMAAALEPSVQVASRPRLDTTDRLYWGQGWGLQLGAGGRAMWQWGHNDGSRAYLLAYPHRGDAFVYFTNGAGGLSIGRRLLEIVGEAAGWPADEHWALDWLGYEPHDVPIRRELRAIVDAFRSDGASAGMARFEASRTREDLDPELLAARTAGALGGLGLPDAELEVLSRNVELHPVSVHARIALAEALTGAGRYEQAMAAYEHAASLDPDDEGPRRGKAWLEPLLAAAESPPQVPAELLERYVGVYGPRHVTLSHGVLYYRRDQNASASLTPLSTDTFQPVSTSTFRIRFVIEGDGPATKIIGMYLDGNRDETVRDP